MIQQDEDVLAAVQRMREEAQTTGYLTSNEAHTVEELDDQIYITPTDPEVVYVPTYDPTVVYTSPPTAQPVIVTPQQQATNPLANPFLAGALGFGGALLVQELFGDDDDDDNDDGWDDYWRRPRPIDYDNRQFYPRPRYGADYAWARERNSYWDRNRGTWQRNAEARRQYDKDRHDTASWLLAPDPRSGQTRASLVRERQKLAVEQARREQRWVDERRNDRRKTIAREERQDAVKKEARQDARAEEARKEKAQQARQDANQKAKAEEARKEKRATAGAPGSEAGRGVARTPTLRRRARKSDGQPTRPRRSRRRKTRPGPRPATTAAGRRRPGRRIRTGAPAGKRPPPRSRGSGPIRPPHPRRPRRVSSRRPAIRKRLRSRRLPLTPSRRSPIRKRRSATTTTRTARRTDQGSAGRAIGPIRP